MAGGDKKNKPPFFVLNKNTCPENNERLPFDMIAKYTIFSQVFRIIHKGIQHGVPAKSTPAVLKRGDSHSSLNLEHCIPVSNAEDTVFIKYR